jgi:hypothetical protein
MAEFRDAMLDPEGYAQVAPTAGIPAAAGTAAAEAQRSAMSMSRADRERASQLGLGATRAAGGSPSTFRETVGEILDEMPARSSRGKTIAIAAAMVVAAGAGLFVFKNNQAKTVAASAPIAAPAAPTTVRVNFTSNPGGAVVVRADTGKELGETPLEAEIPYGDSAVEFVFKKEGYDNKVASVVPNLPAPLFAMLQPAAKPAAAKTESVVAAAQPAAKPTPAAATPSPSSPKKPKKRPAQRMQRLDDDAVLEPTFK